MNKEQGSHIAEIKKSVGEVSEINVEEVDAETRYFFFGRQKIYIINKQTVPEVLIKNRYKTPKVPPSKKQKPNNTPPQKETATIILIFKFFGKSKVLSKVLTFSCSSLKQVNYVCFEGKQWRIESTYSSCATLHPACGLLSLLGWELI